jgi:WD40 repeat protein
LWSVATGELAVTLRGHTDAITSLAFLPDGQTLVTAARDGTVRLWPAAPAAVESRGFSANPETRFLFSRDGRQWAATLRDWAPLLVWDTGAGLARREFNRSGQHVQTEGFDDLAQALVRSLRAPDSDQIQLEWRSSASGERRRTVALEGVFGEPWAHAFQPAMNLIALGQTNGQIRVWDTRTGALLRTFALPDPINNQPALGLPVERLVLSPDGTLLAAGVSSHSQIAVFSVPENRLLYRLQVQPLFKVFDHLADPGRLQWLEFSPDSRLLASTDATEPGIRLWDARTGRAAGRLAGHRDSTVQVAFSPDGRTLASTGADGTLKLWHLPTRREVATLLESGAKGPVGFSPDGTLLLAALLSDQVRAFRAPTLAQLDPAKHESP